VAAPVRIRVSSSNSKQVTSFWVFGFSVEGRERGFAASWSMTKVIEISSKK
jgi:hypothetical protein